MLNKERGSKREEVFIKVRIARMSQDESEKFAKVSNFSPKSTKIAIFMEGLKWNGASWHNKKQINYVLLKIRPVSYSFRRASFFSKSFKIISAIFIKICDEIPIISTDKLFSS